MNFYTIILKVVRRINRRVIKSFDNVFGLLIFKLNGIDVGKKVNVNGFPFIDIHKNGYCTVGSNCSFNSRTFYNPIGRNQKCLIVVGNEAKVSIGNNVGISSSAIISYKSITIGNNVKIGGNTVIYDSDFHSLDYLNRRDSKLDIPNTDSVTIGDDVFIGSHVTILKGISIGNKSIIASGSVVTKNVPENEVWGGNPAKKIR